MIQYTALKFEPGEEWILAKLEHAFNLVGGQSWGRDDPRSKPFRHIRGNQFTWRHVTQATIHIENEAQALLALTAEQCPYPDLPEREVPISIEWLYGVHVNANLAIRLQKDFFELVAKNIREKED